MTEDILFFILRRKYVGTGQSLDYSSQESDTCVAEILDASCGMNTDKENSSQLTADTLGHFHSSG